MCNTTATVCAPSALAHAAHSGTKRVERHTLNHYEHHEAADCEWPLQQSPASSFSHRQHEHKWAEDNN